MLQVGGDAHLAQEHAFVDRQRAVGELAPERLALNERHDVVQQTIDLAGIVQRQNVRMMHLRDYLDAKLVDASARDGRGVPPGASSDPREKVAHLALNAVRLRQEDVVPRVRELDDGAVPHLGAEPIASRLGPPR